MRWRWQSCKNNLCSCPRWYAWEWGQPASMETRLPGRELFFIFIVAYISIEQSSYFIAEDSWLCLTGARSKWNYKWKYSYCLRCNFFHCGCGIECYIAVLLVPLLVSIVLLICPHIREFLIRKANESLANLLWIDVIFFSWVIALDRRPYSSIYQRTMFTLIFQDLPTNGTNGILIRCLPGVREPRRVPLETAPHFAYTPRTQTVRKGSIVDLHCRYIVAYWICHTLVHAVHSITKASFT